MSLEVRLSEHLHERADHDPSTTPSIDVIRHTAKRRTRRTWVGAALATTALLAGVGAVGTSLRPEEPNAVVVADEPVDDEVSEPEPAPAPDDARSDDGATIDDPTPVPTTTIIKHPALPWSPFGLAADGQGGFVSLTVPTDGTFTRSDDGLEWEKAATLNLGELDPPLYFRRLIPADGIIVGELDVLGSQTEPDSPGPRRLAIIRDLHDWDLTDLDLDEKRVPGVVVESRIVEVASVGSSVLLTVSSMIDVDYEEFGIRERDVCTHADTAEGLSVVLCDGIRIDVADRDALRDANLGNRFRYFLSVAGESFVEVPKPSEAPFTWVFRLGDGFGVVNQAGRLMHSLDARSWEPVEPADFVAPPLQAVAIDGRGTLLVSDVDSSVEYDFVQSGGARSYESDSRGYQSTLLIDGQAIAAKLPEEINPSHIMLQPQLAGGPAGWALFVTSFAPGDVVDSDPGWNVSVDGWYVTGRSGAYAVYSADSDERYAYGRFGTASSSDEPPPDVIEDPSGDVLIHYPGTKDLLVRVPRELIDDARRGGELAPQVRTSWLLLSRDGRSWDIVWESTDDSIGWTNVAVGDDEILLDHGGRMTQIPLDDRPG